MREKEFVRKIENNKQKMKINQTDKTLELTWGNTATERKQIKTISNDSLLNVLSLCVKTIIYLEVSY